MGRAQSTGSGHCGAPNGRPAHAFRECCEHRFVAVGAVDLGMQRDEVHCPEGRPALSSLPSCNRPSPSSAELRQQPGLVGVALASRHGWGRLYLHEGDACVARPGARRSSNWGTMDLVTGRNQWTDGGSRYLERAVAESNDAEASYDPPSAGALQPGLRRQTRTPRRTAATLNSRSSALVECSARTRPRRRVRLVGSRSITLEGAIHQIAFHAASPSHRGRRHALTRWVGRGLDRDSYSRYASGYRSRQSMRGRLLIARHPWSPQLQAHSASLPPGSVDRMRQSRTRGPQRRVHAQLRSVRKSQQCLGQRHRRPLAESPPRRRPPRRSRHSRRHAQDHRPPEPQASKILDGITCRNSGRSLKSTSATSHSRQ